MDQYKLSVIEMVRNHPLLWDPSHKDYRSTGPKWQAWEEIEAAVRPPPGLNVTAKGVWGQLTRGFCNVIKKKEKREKRKEEENYGGGSSTEKVWKFEKDLQFLLPVKRARPSAAYTPPEDDDSDLSIDLPETGALGGTAFLDESDSVLSGSAQDADDRELPAAEIKCEADSQNYHDRGDREARHRHKTSLKRKLAHSTKDDHLESTRKFQGEKNMDTPRFLFMRSLMPMIEELSVDDFMDFQINVLQDLRRRRARQENRFHPSYIYQSCASSNPPPD